MVRSPIDSPCWRLTMRPLLSVTVLVLLISAVAAVPAGAAPDRQVTWGVHVSLAPTWFDPAETPGIVTPFMVLYGLHDAMLKALPGNPLAPALAESWTVSPDGLVYEFVLRKGVKFHNGELVTAEDVKFSFERYKGAHAKTLKERVVAVEIPDPGRVRFRLNQPWPDFMTFYGTRTTGAGWVVPKKYVEKVGDEGYKKQPIGSGPYRFVSFTTRVAALKRGEVAVAYLISGELAGDLHRTPGFAIKSVYPSNHWLIFADQF